MVEANGIAMHVAESGGEGSPRAVLVFLHGFPELWYSWRYQMQHLVAWGYRCVAPDLWLWRHHASRGWRCRARGAAALLVVVESASSVRGMVR